MSGGALVATAFEESLDEAVPAASSVPPPSRPKWRLGLGVAGCAALATGATFLYYLDSARGILSNSDGATVALEGQALAAGNLGLHGWSLSLDSFWTIDAV